jgi:4-hydroxythreonine-4-phosphate dehydrogenase
MNPTTMEERKIRVAITQGDTNGIGYEVILKAFEDPTILELCTPIIYGSPKIAAYHRKALNLETNFSIINSAEEARDEAPQAQEPQETQGGFFNNLF